MKITLFISFLLICNISYAENIRVWYHPDKSVRLTVCAEGVPRDECIAKTVASIPELAGLEFEDIDRSQMPDVLLGNTDRNTWEKEKGKPFVINPNRPPRP